MLKVKVRDMDIATGGILVAIISQEVAEQMDLHPEDRIVLKKGNKVTTAVVDIAESSRVIDDGNIGLFEEVLDALNAKDNDTVSIDIQRKPKSISYIKKKLNSKTLTKVEIDEIVKDIVLNNLTDTELAYFVSGCYSNGMTSKETINLTKAIVNFGGHLNFKDKFVVDKHCSGGVPGNRTTMLVVPIVVAAGLKMPKTSSRSITSPAGTADTMEVLAPVILSLEKTKKIVDKVGGCIVWGGAVDLAAADDKLIRVRHSLSLDPEGLLLSSILAKKAAVSSNTVLIDLPIGKDTKIKTIKEADHLKNSFIKIGKGLGMKVKVIKSDGRQPIGNGIGPSLEARDVLYVLRRDEKRPIDLEKKSIMMAGLILEMTGIRSGKKLAEEMLNSGAAYEKMKEIIKAQGGNPDILPEDIELGKYSYTHKAERSGKVKDINNFSVNRIARIAGAPMDHEAGMLFYKHEKDCVKKGEPIFKIFANNKSKLEYAKKLLKEIGCVMIV